MIFAFTFYGKSFALTKNIECDEGKDDGYSFGPTSTTKAQRCRVRFSLVFSSRNLSRTQHRCDVKRACQNDVVWVMVFWSRKAEREETLV